MNYIEAMKARQPAVLKFADPVSQNGTAAPTSTLSPGLLNATTDSFLTCFSETSPIMTDAAVIRMNAVQHNLDYLNAEVNFQSERSTFYNQTRCLDAMDESDLDLNRKTLTAVPVAAYIKVSDNFVEENIEKGNFLNTLSNVLAQRAAPAFEKLQLWKTVASLGSDGIIAQSAKAAADVEPTIEGMTALIEDYIAQGGNIVGAKAYAPATFIARLRADIAKRGTALGDISLTQAGGVEIMGIPMELATNLNPGSDEANPNGTVIVTQPDNIVFGIMRDITVQSEYQLDCLSYLNVVRVKGDAVISCAQDTIVAEVAAPAGG